MKATTKTYKIWNAINEKTTVDTELVLTSIKEGVSNKYLRILLMWLAAKTLRKKGSATLVLSYFKYSFALAIAQPSILEAIIKFIFPENNFRNALLLLIQYYRDSNIDYVIIGLITFVLLYALVLNFFAIKVKANKELIYRQILMSIKPIVPFSDFEHFYQKHEVKQFVDDPIYQKVRSIIGDKTKGHTRLLALSGTGKTFLILSAFLESGDTDNVFYCDEVQHPDMLTAALNIKKEFKEATLILDNCPSDICETVIKRIGDSVRIVSAYYDPFDKTRFASSLSFDDCDMLNVVTHIIDENASKTLTYDQKGKLIHHSGKIPYMALLLVKAFNNSDDIFDSVDSSLLDHLLDIQGQHPNEQRIAMRTLALFQPLDFNNAQSDIAKYLINSNNFTPIEINLNRDLLFKNVVQNMYTRNLIDQDSIFINVRPQPLAIWLVGEWLKDRGNSIKDTIIELTQQENHIKKAILESWARRLEYMQGNEDAVNIYAELVSVNGGPFANEDVVCSDFGSRLILAMSTVNPVAVAECLFAVIFGQSIEWLHNNLIGDARRNVVRTLEKLCFCRDSFHLAALVFARLALAENEAWSNNSVGQFKQLFHIFLAGTESDLDARIAVIKDLYLRGKEYHSLLLSAIKGAFVIDHLTRMGGAERFGFKELEDYSPNGIEISKYWEDLYELLCSWIEVEPENLLDVAEIVQLNTGRFIRGGKPDLLFKFIQTLAPKLNYDWNEMHKSLVETNNYDHPSPVISDKISYWIEMLKPKDIVGRMKIAVHETYIKERTGSEIVKKEEEISIPFADEFIKKKAYLTKEMDTLINNDESYLSWAFTMHLAQNLPIDEIEQMGEYIKKVIFKCDKLFYSPFLVALYRQIPNKQRTKRFIIELYNAQYYTLALPLMAVTDNEERVNLAFALKQVKDGVISFDDVRKYFSAIRLQTSKEILYALNILHNNGADIQLEFDFISSYWYRNDMYEDEELLNSYKSILLRYPLVENNHYNYDYTRQVDGVLKKSDDSNFAKKINRKLIGVLSYHPTHNGLEDLYSILLTKYRKDIWQEFIEALTDIDNRSGFFIHLRYEIGSGLDFGEKALFKGHEEEMKVVCKKFPKYGPWICAAMCPVFDQANQETGEVESFHPFAIWLIENYGNDPKILDEFHANLGTFHWAGSTLPLYEKRKRCFENLLNNPKLSSNVKEWIRKCLTANNNDYDREVQNEAYRRLAYNNQ